jgi:hypothetical protein
LAVVERWTGFDSVDGRCGSAIREVDRRDDLALLDVVAALPARLRAG